MLWYNITEKTYNITQHNTIACVTRQQDLWYGIIFKNFLDVTFCKQQNDMHINSSGGTTFRGECLYRRCNEPLQ